MATFVLGIILLVVVKLLVVNGESVSLIVEGGVSLVGPHCPGTVRLFCEGVDLTTFTWMYNGDFDIADSYHPDSSITTPTNTSNPAFVSVQLTDVSQSSHMIYGNFSSVLIVDLSQLEQQNIMSISCGDPGIKRTIPVNVQIVQQTVPAAPQLNNTQIANIFENQTNATVFTYTIVLISWERQQLVRDQCISVWCRLSSSYN